MHTDLDEDSKCGNTDEQHDCPHTEAMNGTEKCGGGTASVGSIIAKPCITCEPGMDNKAGVRMTNSIKGL